MKVSDLIKVFCGDYDVIVRRSTGSRVYFSGSIRDIPEDEFIRNLDVLAVYPGYVVTSEDKHDKLKRANKLTITVGDL